MQCSVVLVRRISPCLSCSDVTVFAVLLYPDHILIPRNWAGLAHTEYLLNTQRQLSFCGHLPCFIIFIIFIFIYLQVLLQCRYIYNCKLSIVDCPDNCDGAVMMMHDPGCRDN